MHTFSKTRRVYRRAVMGQRPQVAKPARIPSGAEPGHEQSSGLFVPGEGLGHQAQRGLQGRPVYSPDEGLT